MNNRHRKMLEEREIELDVYFSTHYISKNGVTRWLVISDDEYDIDMQIIDFNLMFI